MTGREREEMETMVEEMLWWEKILARMRSKRRDQMRMMKEMKAREEEHSEGRVAGFLCTAVVRGDVVFALNEREDLCDEWEIYSLFPLESQRGVNANMSHRCHWMTSLKCSDELPNPLDSFAFQEWSLFFSSGQNRIQKVQRNLYPLSLGLSYGEVSCFLFFLSNNLCNVPKWSASRHLSFQLSAHTNACLKYFAKDSLASNQSDRVMNLLHFAETTLGEYEEM
jgi:hypothetical protein